MNTSLSAEPFDICDVIEHCTDREKDNAESHQLYLLEYSQKKISIRIPVTARLMARILERILLLISRITEYE